MIATKNEPQTRTLARLIRAMDAQNPITITYLKDEKDTAGKPTGHLAETVRTIEIYDVTVSKQGDLLIKAMDRATQESRTWRLDRIKAYTVHRMQYVVERAEDEPTTAVPSLRLAEATIADRCVTPLASAEAETRRHMAMLTDLLAA